MRFATGVAACRPGTKKYKGVRRGWAKRHLSDGKSYRVVGNTGHWPVAEDGAEPAGDYATRESALEAISLAASNDIKSGHGVTIRIDPAPPNAPASGGQP